jgi:cobalt-zinc-cadmium efflux system membrane fusion protein
MKQRTIAALTALTVIGAGSLFWACSGEITEKHKSEAETSAAVDEHAGHNHAQGEHGKAVGTDSGTTPDVSDWCVEHRVPESECTLCHPELVETFKAKGDWCAGHGLPESHCRLCNPDLKFPQEEILRSSMVQPGEDEIRVALQFRPNATACATDGALIQFASTQTAERAGITVQQVRSSERQSTVEAPAEVVFDETRTTVITTTVPALVSRWLAAPGDVVTSGQELALLQSPEIARLGAELLSSHAALQTEEKELVRQDELSRRDLISAREYEIQKAATEQARAAFDSVRGLMLSAGLSDNDVADLLARGQVTNQFVLRAPGPGMLVERVAQLGELIDAGRAFAMVADPSSMWIEARLAEEQMRHVNVGQELTFTCDGYGLDRVGAEIIWVSRFLDPHTRMGTVRARVIDRQHDLKAGEFGRATIVEQSEQHVTLVPKESVQWEGCCNVVFVRETVDRYRPRKVELFDGTGAYYQVTGGLNPGEEVVVNGAFLLKTELKKTSIGAGCCGLEPAG